MGIKGEEFNPEHKEEVVSIIKVASDFEVEGGKHPEIEVDKKAPGLFLFDIDGTLILAEELHFRALFDSYKAQLPEDGNFSEENFKPFAKLYHSNFGYGLMQANQRILEALNIEQKSVDFKQLDQDYDDKFIDNLNRMPTEEKNKLLIPGAMDMLKNINRQKQPAAIVTGNSKKRALALIKAFDLGKYFLVGAYDEDSHETPKGELSRSYIVKKAIERVKEKVGVDYPVDQIIALGDTPKDFQATFLKGQRQARYSVLVSTGGRSLEELGKVTEQGVGADLVLPELHLTGNEKDDDELKRRIKG